MVEEDGGHVLGAEILEEVEVRSGSVSPRFPFGIKFTISVNGGHGFSHFGVQEDLEDQFASKLPPLKIWANLKPEEEMRWEQLLLQVQGEVEELHS